MEYAGRGQRLHPDIDLTADIVLGLSELVRELAITTAKGYARRHRRRVGQTLRPGPDTPLWNALTCAINVHLTRRGDQAKLGRILGLPRQRVHEMCRQRGLMPDAERTLKLLLWIHAKSQGRDLG